LSSERRGHFKGLLGDEADNLGFRFRAPKLGQDVDADTGLTDMQARLYDPLIGRFLSTDPIEFNASSPFTFNRYSYANNNPYRYTDPTGAAVETIPELISWGTHWHPPLSLTWEWPKPITIVVPVIEAASLAVAVGVVSFFVPSNLGNDDTCDNGNCDDYPSKKDATTMDSRQPYVPGKAGRHKQGRQRRNKNRGMDNFKPRNPPREPKPYTPSKKT
jgi:RHS repeat-associated protein